jgi:ribose 5-phosphate isomerase B
MIGIGSDHHGLLLKEKLHLYLVRRGERVRDFGTFSPRPVDYPDIAGPLALAAQTGEIDAGILVCRTGLGTAIAANKVPGVFATPVTDVYSARKARESNDAQVITLGASRLSTAMARAIVDAWLSARFRGGESARKLGKIRALEAKCAWTALLASQGGGP